MNAWSKLNQLVYTLWANPQIVPLLHTSSVVLKKLQGGADLMTPGLQRGPPFPAKAKKDSIVAVASLENPSVPLMVGVCKIDISSLQQVQGLKGHAVEGIHWSGDEIWAWSQTGKPGADMPDPIEAWDPEALAQDFSVIKVTDDVKDARNKSEVAFSKSRTDDSLHNDVVYGEKIENKPEVIKEMSTKGKRNVLESSYDYR